MIVFRSEVGPDIMMFDAVAQRMMELMGKEKAERGVVIIEQLPDAIARLKAAAALDRAQAPAQPDDAEDADAIDAPVGLAQRAVPLIELLELSLARGKPVTWGV